MTNDGVERARKIFKEAIDLSGAERDAFVEAASAGDQSLRDRVDQLLQAFDSDASRLVDTKLTAATPGTRIGSQIGRFRILEKIGEGGFGEVWLAEQTEPVRRRVAIKIIKRGMDSAQVVARFEAERQALAMMEHPNIARVYDGGETDEGRPYFVMELVKGMPITEYCERRKLDLADRIRLFGQVCAGVQHAHQKGVIHRDLKPNNVLVGEVDDKPVAKVIDFGIAKALERPLTDKTLFTEFRQFIGTPEYMSPEQAELSLIDVDTRSDVYALGVMLYELLAGQPPFDPKSLRSVGFDEMRRIIREEEPPPPSSKLTHSGSGQDGDVPDPELGKLGKLVRGELDWIVQRAMAKERDRRYASANDLEEDLSRYLRNEPVRAGRPGRLYRASRFVRRNRLAVSFVGTGIAALLVIAILLGAGLIVLSGNYEELQRAQAKERSANQQVEASLVAQTAALEKVEAAQFRTKAALADAEDARDRAETSRERLDEQVSAMQIVRAGELARTDQMQSIAQLDLVPDQNRNWVWRMLRATLPTRRDLASVEQEILCDVSPDGERALLLRRSGYTLRYDIVSLAEKTFIVNLLVEDFETTIKSLVESEMKKEPRGFVLPASMMMTNIWRQMVMTANDSSQGGAISRRNGLIGHSGFSGDGRRIVLETGAFASFRNDLIESIDQMKDAMATIDKINSGDFTAPDPDSWKQEPTVVSVDLLRVFDAETGRQLASLPRQQAPDFRYGDMEALNWVTDPAASCVVVAVKGDSMVAGDEFLLVLRVEEDESLAMELSEIGAPFTDMPLAISSDGGEVAFMLQATRWNKSPGDGFEKITVQRIGTTNLRSESLDATVHEVPGEGVVSIAFARDRAGLFMLTESARLRLVEPADSDWSTENVPEIVFDAELALDEIGPLHSSWWRAEETPRILHPISETALLIASGSRITEVETVLGSRAGDDWQDAVKVVNRFDLGDPWMSVVRPPTSTEAASIVTWSDKRISLVDLGNRIATCVEVDESYPTAGAYARVGTPRILNRTNDVPTRVDLRVGNETIEFEKMMGPPVSISPSGRFAISPKNAEVIDLQDGSMRSLDEIGPSEVNPLRLVTLRSNFDGACWVLGPDGRELICGRSNARGNTGSFASNVQNRFNERICTWDAQTGALEHTAVVKGHRDGGVFMLRRLCAAREGDLVALYGTFQRTVNPLQFIDGETFDVQAHHNEYMGMATSPESMVMVIDRRSGEVLMSEVLPGKVGGLAIANDGSTVACLSQGDDVAATAQVILYSAGPDRDWSTPDLRKNNITDAYLHGEQVSDFWENTPILSVSPDGKLLSVALASRLDILDLRSNTWLMSWTVEDLKSMVGCSEVEYRRGPFIRAAAFDMAGGALNVSMHALPSNLFIRIVDATLPADEGF